MEKMQKYLKFLVICEVIKVAVIVASTLIDYSSLKRELYDEEDY